MQEIVAPLCRHFSAIDGIQRAYSLIYSMDKEEAGLRLTVCRTGENARMDSLILTADPERGYGLLRYLHENAVQPEIWRDVVAELSPLLAET